MSVGYDAQDEGDGQQRVQSAVEDVPETNVVTTNLPELGQLVTDEAEREDVH